MPGRSCVGELKAPDKPFDISKRAVWEAYEKVRANAEFEKDLKNNLYKIWNRMSSGSYFPPPVRAVEIPKPHGGGTRTLGVPTVADRIAQTVVAGVLERGAEPVFHPDSHGYRPGRSAIDAVAACRERCWRHDWVIDLDIRKFFDSVPWDLMLKAVAAHTDQSWVLLYVRRWLAAPLQLPDGTLQQRDRGTPQGSAVSPILANLFLHYAFDAWMARTFPTIPFERYVDDVVVHCVSERQARYVLEAIGKRMSEERGGADSAPGEDPDRVLPGRQPARPVWARRVRLPGVRIPETLRADQGRQAVRVVPARDQQTGTEQDQRRGAVMATAPSHTPDRKGPRTKDQPDRARLDAVLWGLLPVGPASPPGTHQRLPDAVDPQETRATAGQEKGPNRVEPSR